MSKPFRASLSGGVLAIALLAAFFGFAGRVEAASCTISSAVTAGCTLSTSGDALTFSGSGTLTVAGTAVTTTNTSGTVTIDTSGTSSTTPITGSTSASTISIAGVGGAVTITNASGKSIRNTSTGAAITLASGTSATINNSGTISTNTLAQTAIDNSASANKMTINLSGGTITGVIKTGTGGDVVNVTSSGSIGGMTAASGDISGLNPNGTATINISANQTLTYVCNTAACNSAAVTLQAKSITLNSGSTLTFSALSTGNRANVSANIDGDADGHGTLAFTSGGSLTATTINGDVGMTHALSAITFANLNWWTISGSVKANSIVLGTTSTGSATFQMGAAGQTSTLYGTVTTSNAGQNTFAVTSAATVVLGAGSAVGTSATPLGTVSLAAGADSSHITVLDAATNNADIFATRAANGGSIAIGNNALVKIGTGAFNVSVIGGTTASSAGIIEFVGSQALSGAVSIGGSSAAGTGGLVGQALGGIQIDSGATLDLTGLTSQTANMTVAATTVGGTLKLGGSGNNGTTGALAGTIDGFSAGTGIVQFMGDYKAVIGNIGGTNRLALVEVGTNKTLDVTGASAASVTGSLNASGVLNVSAVGSGTLYSGSVISGTGITPGTKILNQISGTPGGAGTYQTTMSSSVAATTITVSNGTPTVSATQIQLDAGATLKVGTGAVTGKIDGDAAGNGALEVADNAVANGNIGSSNALSSVQVDASKTYDLSVNNNTIAASNGVTLQAGATLKLGTGSVTGRINGDAAGHGTLEIAGNNTLVNSVGANFALASVVVDASKTLDASANNKSISASQVTLNSGSTLKLGTGAVTGNIDGDTAGDGNLEIAGNNTTNGNIGANFNLASLVVDDGKTLDLSINNNTIAASQVTLGNAGAGTAKLVLGTGSVSAPIDGDNDGKGILEIAAGNTLAGSVGATHALASVVVDGSATLDAATNNSSIAATQITLNSGSTLKLGTGIVKGAVDGNAANHGALEVAGNNALNGDIGSSFSLASVLVDVGTTLDASTNNNSIAASQVTLNSGSTLKLGTGSVTGKIDGDAANHGTLEIAGNNTLNGDIGSSLRLASVVVDASKTLDAAANNNSIAATQVTLNSGSTLKLGTGLVSGPIDGDAANHGTLEIKGNNTLSNATGGTHSLAAVNVDNGATLTLGADIAATTTTIASGGKISIGAGSATVTGDLVNNGTLNLGTGVLTVASGAVTGTGTIALDLNTGSTHGYIVNNSGATSLAALTIAPTWTGAGVTNGATYLLVQGYGGSGLPAIIDPAGSSGSWQVVVYHGSATTDADGLTIHDGDLIMVASNSAPVVIPDGTTRDLTPDTDLDATGVIVGDNGAGTAVLKVGTGTVAAPIDGDVNGAGTLDVADNNILVRAVGAVHALGNVLIEAGKTLDAATNNEPISATQVTLYSGSTLKLGTGSVTGKIDGDAANHGTLEIAGNNTLNGNVGSSFGLASLVVDASKTLDAATNNNSIAATQVTLSNGSTLKLGTGSVTGKIDGDAADHGTLEIAGNNTLNGNVGSSFRLASLVVDASKALDAATNNNSIAATQVTLNNGSTLKLGTGSVTGKIDGDAANHGTLEIAGNNTLNGNIGSSFRLASLLVDAGNNLDASANNNSIAATQVTLNSGSMLKLGTGSVTGKIDGDAANHGTLEIAGNNTTAGNVGSSFKLASVVVDASKTLDAATNNNTIAATQVTLNNGSTLKLGTGSVTGKIDGDAANHGTLEIAGNNTLNGNVGSSFRLASLVVDASKTLDAATNNNSIAATQVTLNSGSTLKLGTGSVTGKIDGDAANHGTLEIAGNNTSNGDIGSSFKLASLILDASKTFDTSVNGNSIAATNLTLGTGSTLKLGSGTVTGAIDGNAAGNGALIYAASNSTNGAIGSHFALSSVNVNAGVALTLKNNLSATTTTIASTGSVTLGASALTLTGNLVNNGTMNLGTNALTIASGALTGSGTVTLSLNSGAAHGYLISNDAGTSLNAMTIAPTWGGTGTVANGATYVLVKGYAGGPVTASIVNPTGSGGTWSVGVYSGGATTDADGIAINPGDLVMVASVASSSAPTTGLPEGNAAPVETLNTYSGSNPDLLNLKNKLASLPQAEVDGAGAQLRPDINGAASQSAFGATDQFLGVVSAHNDSMRQSSVGETGVSTGEATTGAGIWGQVFGAHADQRSIDGIDGYGADTFGLAIGADREIGAPLRLGLAAAYAHTKLDDSGARNGSGMKVNSYIASLYGIYTGLPRLYVDGALTYGLHDYSTSRLVTFVLPNELAKGDFTGQQFGAKLTGGYPIAFGRSTITPLASADYNFLHQSGYAETGAGGASLVVDGKNTYSMRTGLGFKFIAELAERGGWVLRPNANIVWYHEFNPGAPDMTARYAGGGSAFSSPGVKLGTDDLNMGAGLDLLSGDSITLSAKYDLDLKDQYTGHTGQLQIRVGF